MANWQLIATTVAEQNLYSSFQVKIYADTTANVTPKSDKLTSDLQLRRGSSSAKEHKAGFVVTQITFSLKDSYSYIYDFMSDADSGSFRAEVYKDGVIFFKGTLLLLSSKKNINETHPVIKLKIFDSITELQKYNDYSVFPTGLMKVSEIVRTIFNKLNYSFDIKVFQNMYIGSTAASGTTFESNYARIGDYLFIKNNATYYDVLKMIAEQFQWEIFQYEGTWVCRQIVTMKYIDNPTYDYIREHTINNTTGAVTSTTVNLNRQLLFDDLAAKGFVFKGRKYGTVKLKIASFDPKVISKHDNETTFVNPDFSSGNLGWTTVSGTPKFTGETLIMNVGDEVKQTITISNPQQEVKIKLKAFCFRLITPLTETNNLASLQFLDSNGITWYYNKVNSTWGGAAYFSVNNTGHYTSFNNLGPNYIKEYSAADLNLDLKVTTPNDIGTLSLHLIGGSANSGNNYPKEFVNYNFAKLDLVQTDDNNDIIPTNYYVKAIIGDREKVEDVIFNDLDPFNVNLWHSDYDYGSGTTTYSRTVTWNTELGTKTFMEYIAQQQLGLLQNNQGLDAKIIPGKTLKFNEIIYSTIESAITRYYLPIYEETELINDKKRFVLIEHNHATISPTIVKEYVF